MVTFMKPSNKSYNKIIADYFLSLPHFFDGNLQKKPHIRKCVELPYQQTKAELWDEVTDTLCNLDFIQAKACAKMTYDLVKDFNDVLDLIPDNEEYIRQEKAAHAKVEKYTTDLISYIKGEIPELLLPETIPLWSEDRIKAEIERIKTIPNRLDRLKDFRNFLGAEAADLQRYSFEFPFFSTQQAWNWGDEGPVRACASARPESVLKSLMLKSEKNLPHWTPLPQAIHILKEQGASFYKVAISVDGKLAASADGNRCLIWDLENGEIIRRLDLPSTHVGTYQNVGIAAMSIISLNSIATIVYSNQTCISWDLQSGQPIKEYTGIAKNIMSITPDGRNVVSYNPDENKCLVIDLESKSILHTFERPGGIDINTYVYTPDFKKVLYSLNDYSSGGKCFIQDAESGRLVLTLDMHSRYGRINAIDVTPDCKRAITSSNDNNCIVWDLITGREINVLKGHTDFIISIAITPDGSRAISSADESCIVWDLNTLPEYNILEKHSLPVNALSITPDGNRAFSGCGNDISFVDNSCILWNINTGTPIFVLEGHRKAVKSVDITPDCKRAISGSADESCIVWDLEHGRSIITTKANNGSIEAVAITPDGKKAVSGTSRGICTLWDLDTGRTILYLKGHNSSIKDITITSDGRKVVSVASDHTCLIWDIIDSTEPQTSFEILGMNSVVAVTPDGKWAVSDSVDNTFTLWDLSNRISVFNMAGHTSSIEVAAISPDGKRAITGSSDKTCILWDLTAGKSLSTLHGHFSEIIAIDLTPDGKRAVSGSRDHKCIVWDLINTSAVSIQKGHSAAVNVVSTTPDGKTAISGSEDRTCIIWDLKRGLAVNILGSYKDHSRAIYAAAITPGSKTAISGSEDETCIIWDLNTGQKIKQLTDHTRTISELVITPDGKGIISCSGTEKYDDSRFIPKPTGYIESDQKNRPTIKTEIFINILWNLETGMPVHKLKGHTYCVMCASITPDGKRAITGSWDRTCIIWNLVTGKEVSRLIVGDIGSINAMALTPDGRKMIAIYDKETYLNYPTLIVWDLRSGEALKKSVKHNVKGGDLAVTPDGVSIISSGESNTCVIWDLESEKNEGIYVADSFVNSISCFPGGVVLGEKSGKVSILNLGSNLTGRDICQVTLCSTWDYEEHAFHPPEANCPLCGCSLGPPQTVLATIHSITKNADLKPDQSPCLELPDKAWDDPGLACICTGCGANLRFNPFISGGNRESKPAWKFWKR
jgi:WD40 repeat protein